MHALRPLLILLAVASAACSGGTVATTTIADTQAAAIEYAASADRALDGTAFSDVPVGTIADVIVGLCEGTGPGTVEAAVDALDARDGPAIDDEILGEVLAEGVRQVCPHRAGASALVEAYLVAVDEVAADRSIDEDAVLTAGLVACDLLDRGQGAESSLLAVVATLFGVETASVGELETLLDRSQGVLAGATLQAAAGYLCSRHQAAVAAYLEGLGP